MTTKPAEISTSDDELTRRARRAFFVGLFDMSWKLGAGMLAPLFAGLFIDSRVSGDSQTFAIIGFFSGMVVGVIIIRQIVRKLGKN